MEENDRGESPKPDQRELNRSESLWEIPGTQAPEPVGERGPSRWPRILTAVILIVFVIAVVWTIATQRRPRGAVPGDAQILSIAVLSDGFVVGADDGAYASTDSLTWEKLFGDVSTPVHVSSYEGTVALRYPLEQGAVIARLIGYPDDEEDFQTELNQDELGTAVALSSEGFVTYVADASDGAGFVLAVDRHGRSERLDVKGKGPTEINALAVTVGSQPRILAGGITSGLWQARVSDGMARWERLLGTSTKSVLIDPGNTSRILLGTPGSLLISTDSGRSWSFSELREPIEGLGSYEGVFYAMTNERILFSSNDPSKAWQRVEGPPG